MSDAPTSVSLPPATPAGSCGSPRGRGYRPSACLPASPATSDAATPWTGEDIRDVRCLAIPHT